MSLQIGGASIGYDVNGMQQLINDINVDVIPVVCKTLRNESQKVRTTIDTVWVGASAEAFKDKIDRDTTTLCDYLVQLGEAITNELNNAGSNVEDYDAEIANQLFPGYSSSSGGGGGTSFGSQVGTGFSNLTNSNNDSSTSSTNFNDLKEGDIITIEDEPVPVSSGISSVAVSEEVVNQTSAVQMIVDDTKSVVETDDNDSTGSNESNTSMAGISSRDVPDEVRLQTGAPKESAEKNNDSSQSVEQAKSEQTEIKQEDAKENSDSSNVGTVPAESQIVETFQSSYKSEGDSSSTIEEIEVLDDENSISLASASPESTVKAVSESSYETPSGNVATSKPSSGFQVTTGNAKVELSDDDFNLLCTIVQRESSADSFDDKLAVASVILNRTEDSAYVYSNGPTVRDQITGQNQFSTYHEGMTYDSTTYDEQTKQAVMDALSGIRNNEFLSFRSNKTQGYSDNLITESGNRYK